MKKESQTRQTLKQAVFRHRKKFMQGLFEKRPCNCKFNRELSLPQDFISVEKSLHVCVFDGWKNLVCDENFSEGLEQAQKCEDFSCKHETEEAKRTFLVSFENKSILDVARDYPDVAALMWVLEVAKFGDLNWLEAVTDSEDSDET